MTWEPALATTPSTARALSLLLICSLLVFTPAPRAVAETAQSPATDAATSTSLPLAARYALSDSLGRLDPAYHAREADGMLALENPTNGIVGTVDGFTLLIASGDGSWSAELAGWGRGENLVPPVKRGASTHENRIETRADGLIAWYRNGPLGLQQGWTIAERPAGDGALTLTLTHGGTLRAVVDADGRGLALQRDGGWNGLRWSGLLAWDAAGRELPAWLEAAEGETWLRVLDDGAHYPVTIDPWVQAARLTASSAVDGDELGTSVAISADGTTVVAGTPHCGCSSQGGSAYVFLRPAGGWTTTATFAARLQATDIDAGDSFGSAVSISEDGSTIVVGSPNDDGVAPDGGAAYVFVRPVGGWASTTTANAKITATGSQSGDSFGLALMLSGDGATLAVGASNFDTSANDVGAVYVYLKPAGDWATTSSFAARLTAFDGFVGDGLGLSVAISRNGDTIVAGAPNADAGDQNCGALYVFSRPVGGWATTSNAAKLLPSDTSENAGLGFAVAISADGSTIAGGTAYFFVLAGEVFIYVRPAGGWVSSNHETARITAESETDGAAFGSAVALSADGGLLLVGAAFASGVQEYSGAAFVYTRPGGGWTSTSSYTQKLQASDGATQDGFGVALAMTPDGNTFVVGAPGSEDPPGTLTGAAYTFVRPAIGGINPASGSPGTFITITGVNLEGATSVTFGGTAALSYTVESSTRIVARVGFGSSGTVEVESRGIVASFGPFTFVPGPTTTTITGVSPNPALVGQTVTVSFTVASALGPPTGKVRVFDGGSNCEAMVSEGRCFLTSGSPGTKSLRAEFEGGSAFAGSTSPAVQLTVRSATTTHIVEVTPNPSVVGQNVLVRFDVDADHGTPTGMVTVSDGQVSCTAPVLTAQCSLPSTVAGVREIRANYLGDGDFLPSVSAPFSQTVLPPPPGTPTATPIHPSPTPTLTPMPGTPTATLTPMHGTPTATPIVSSPTPTLTPIHASPTTTSTPGHGSPTATSTPIHTSPTATPSATPTPRPKDRIYFFAAVASNTRL